MIRMGCLIVGLWCASSLSAGATSTLTTTPNINASQLDLDGEGNASTHIIKVADVVVSTDNSSGLTLTISSGTIDRMGGQPIGFQITTVPDNASPPTSENFSTPSGNSYIYMTSSAGTENRDVYIRYTPLSFQDPGNYTGAIDLAIIDN